MLILWEEKFSIIFYFCNYSVGEVKQVDFYGLLISYLNWSGEI